MASERLEPGFAPSAKRPIETALAAAYFLFFAVVFLDFAAADFFFFLGMCRPLMNNGLGVPGLANPIVSLGLAIKLSIETSENS